MLRVDRAATPWSVVSVLVLCLLGAAPVAAQEAAVTSPAFERVERAGPAAAQPDAALNMQEVVDRAVNWHPQLRQAQGQLLQAGESITAARAGYYPRISAGVNTRAGNHELTGYDSRRVHRAELTAQQTLYDFGKVKNEVAGARASHEATRADAFVSLDEVVRNTARAWIEVRRQQALVTVAQEQLEAVGALSGLAERRESEGASTYSDTIQARARVEAAEVSLLTAESQVRRWRSNLMHWVGGGILPQVAGEPVAELESVCAQVADASFTETEAAVREASTVQRAQAQLTMAQAGSDLAKSQERPTLSMDVSAGHGLNERSRRPEESGMETTVMLNFSMPLYEGGRLQADRRAAEYGVQAARAELERARLDAAQGLQDAALMWNENTSRLDVQRARAESMRMTRSLYHDQYLQLGTRSLLDLLNAEQEYHAARRDLIDSEHDLYRSGLDCVYYMGRIDDAFGLESVVAHAFSGADESGPH